LSNLATLQIYGANVGSLPSFANLTRLTNLQLMKMPLQVRSFLLRVATGVRASDWSLRRPFRRWKRARSSRPWT
jgi:hypothetical protein